jgi:putative tryptophan/tyrosine transport system substrate-binding protein
MRRRDFIAAAGCAAMPWPVNLRAQATPPAVGFFRSTPREPFVHLVTAFRDGLSAAGFVDGRDVAIEERYGDNRNERLAELAAELIERRVAAIVGNIGAVNAARAASSTIPIVFVVGDDPVKSGLVSNLGRPGGNLTGVTFFGGGQLSAKKVELLHELVRAPGAFAVLLDPSYAESEVELPDTIATARALGRDLVIAKAAGEGEFDAAFGQIAESGAVALLVSGSPLYTSRRRELVALAARHAIPAIYDLRELVVDGGLISYSASISAAYRQAGLYAGRILHGASPSDLPVLRPTEFELVLNLRTARALGLEVPQSILLRANEVIE